MASKKLGFSGFKNTFIKTSNDKCKIVYRIYRSHSISYINRDKTKLATRTDRETKIYNIKTKKPDFHKFASYTVIRKYVPHTGRLYTRLQCPVASCGKPEPVDRGSSKVLPLWRRAAVAMRSKPDRDGHSADSSRRHRGPPTDNRPAAWGRSSASNPSRRPPNITCTPINLKICVSSVCSLV